MTTALLIAVVALTVLVALDLVLTMGVLRRLRDHSDRLAALASPPPSRLSGGEPVPRPVAQTTAGAPLEALLSGSAPVPMAFFSAGCAGCRTHLPEFLSYLEGGGVNGGVNSGVVVISGDEREGADLIAAAAAAPHLVVEADDGPVTAAFQIQAFPAFFWLRDGQVGVVTSAVRGLPAAAPA